MSTAKTDPKPILSECGSPGWIAEYDAREAAKPINVFGRRVDAFGKALTSEPVGPINFYVIARDRLRGEFVDAWVLTGTFMGDGVGPVEGAWTLTVGPEDSIGLHFARFDITPTKSDPEGLSEPRPAEQQLFWRGHLRADDQLDELRGEIATNLESRIGLLRRSAI